MRLKAHIWGSLPGPRCTCRQQWHSRQSRWQTRRAKRTSLTWQPSFFWNIPQPLFTQDRNIPDGLSITGLPLENTGFTGQKPLPRLRSFCVLTSSWRGEKCCRWGRNYLLKRPTHTPDLPLHIYNATVTESESQWNRAGRSEAGRKSVRSGRKLSETGSGVEKSSSALDGPVATESDAGRHLPTAILLLAHRWATAQILKYKVRQIRISTSPWQWHGGLLVGHSPNTQICTANTKLHKYTPNISPHWLCFLMLAHCSSVSVTLKLSISRNRNRQGAEEDKHTCYG